MTATGTSKANNATLIRHLDDGALSLFLGYETELPPWCRGDICDNRCERCAAEWLAAEPDYVYWENALRTHDDNYWEAALKDDADKR